MNRDDRIKRILTEAGVESAVRRPAEVVALRSAFLSRTAGQPEPEPTVEVEPVVPEGAYIWPEWMQWPLRLAKYLGFLCVLVAILMVVAKVRETLILADVGRATCSTLKVADAPEAQVYWTEEDAASTVPKLRARQFVACMKAGSPF